MNMRENPFDPNRPFDRQSNYPKTPDEWEAWDAVNAETPMAPSRANPGEGQSFDAAKYKEYADGSKFMIWDQPGQIVELAPIRKESAPGRWCLAESDDRVMPDIFGVYGGDLRSVVAIETALGNLLILQDGKLYAHRDGQLVAERNLEEYFPVDHPVIGDTWIIPRRNGGEPLQIKDIRSIGVKLTPFLDGVTGAVENSTVFQNRSVSTGRSVIKSMSDALRRLEDDRWAAR